VALALVYLAINRWGVRLPLKPFFGVTSAFLYYMAFVFAGKGIAELQDGGVVSNTILLGWPRLPALGVYPTVESMLAQAVMALFALAAVAWIFGVQRRRDALAPPPPPAPAGPAVPADSDAVAEGTPPEELMLRSLERMEADLGALKAEVERLRQTVVEISADQISKP
jgi:hypothetical protein